MQTIQLSGKNYPIRFDFRALKEYKAISKNDVLVAFEKTTDNVITLTYAAMKSGHLFVNPNSEFPLNEDQVSGLLELSDINKVTDIFMDEVNKVAGNDSDGGEAKQGEASGIA